MFTRTALVKFHLCLEEMLLVKRYRTSTYLYIVSQSECGPENVYWK